MSRQLDKESEDRQLRRERKLGILVDGGLLRSLEWAGVVPSSFTVRLNGYDTLLVLKGELAGKPVVCFVGASDFAGCLLKCDDLARRDALKWRPDKFAG
jgi:hypothetical protein